MILGCSKVLLIIIVIDAVALILLGFFAHTHLSLLCEINTGYPKSVFCDNAMRESYIGWSVLMFLGMIWVELFSVGETWLCF